MHFKHLRERREHVDAMVIVRLAHHGKKEDVKKFVDTMTKWWMITRGN